MALVTQSGLNTTQLGLGDHGSANISGEEHSAAGIISYVTDVLLTSAQVLDLADTQPTIVAAPGANRITIFKGATLFLDYNSAAYVTQTDDDLQFKYTDASGAAVSAPLEARGFVDQTNDEYLYAPPITTVEVIPVANAAIVLDNTGADFITGNSPIKIRVWCEQWDLSTLADIS